MYNIHMVFAYMKLILAVLAWRCIDAIQFTYSMYNIDMVYYAQSVRGAVRCLKANTWFVYAWQKQQACFNHMSTSSTILPLFPNY